MAKGTTRATPKGRVATRHGGGKLADAAKPAGGSGSPGQGNVVGGNAPARGVPASKYDALTVYDPATRTVRDGAGNVVTQPAPPTLAELSQLPGPLAYLQRLYECEPSDDTTIALLAEMAECTIGALEDKRCAWKEPPPHCPPVVRENRRRCWRCPRWKDADAARTPFDS